jgi:phage terminase large subunit-like protein
MVRATIHAADPNVPVHLITASRGKAVRAEPISVRYAQRQVHHASRFAKLEDQLCAFAPAGYGGTGSPDHADAAIWALTYLVDMGGRAGIIEFYRREAEASR